MRPPKRPIENSPPRAKHLAMTWRLTRMQIRLRPVASSMLRTLAMVGLAVLLILVLLPAAVAAQAATAL